MALCLTTTIAHAGQTDDMNLCAERIKAQYKVDVIKKWFDINGNCQTNERHLVFSDGKELYDCKLNRKNNFISVMNRMLAGEVLSNITEDYQYMIDAAFPEKVPAGRCGLIRENQPSDNILPEEHAIDKSLFNKQAKAEKDKETKETIEACKRAIKENADDDVIFYDYDKIEKDKEYESYFVIGEQPAEFLGLFDSGIYRVLCYRGRDEYSSGKTQKQVTVWFKSKSGLAIRSGKSYRYTW
jgi:hypothetical protein